MKIRKAEVAALRALLAGDRELFEQLEPGADTPGYYMLSAGALVEAVVRRFGRTRLEADVVRYVADVRARVSGDGTCFDPVAAEQLIRAALGEAPAVAAIKTIDRDILGLTQVALMERLVADEQLDAVGLDAFLAGARVRAEALNG